MRISDWSSDVCSSDLVYLDLDTVVAGDLAPLAGWDAGPFGLCANFTRLAGHSAWPCRYGSCVMSLAEGDWKSGVSGKSVSVRVDLGGRRIIEKKKYSISGSTP